MGGLSVKYNPLPDFPPCGATKLLSDEEIEKIKRCLEQDSCDCRSLFHLHKQPWSNRFSYTLKQISIARCPMILCIDLKRVSVNIFGELVKLQGHISFPLVLDLLQFRTTEVGIKSWEENMKRHDQIKRNHIYGSTRGSIYPEELASDLTESCGVVPSNTSLYHVAVVKNFGRAGSGHYTVYRTVRADLCDKEPSDGSEFDAAALCWFSISDSQSVCCFNGRCSCCRSQLSFLRKI
ncbi:unnamed protein product [Malus baccata var. baccata]